MPITEQFLRDIAAEHNGTVDIDHNPFAPNARISLPNGTQFSLIWGASTYSSNRRLCVGQDIPFPVDAVEIAYWNENIKGGDMLPDNDVHGWQNEDEVRILLATAAALVPDVIEGTAEEITEQRALKP